MRYIKLARSAIVTQKKKKKAVYLIECQTCGEQYNGSAKRKFRFRANNYKSTQRKFVNKEAVSKQALKQKRFNEHCCSDRHNGILL